jgi:nucleoside-diphosphate-sugar epimerase
MKQTMQVLLTGATGFLGKRVLKQLTREGQTVRCAVRATSDTESLREFVGTDNWNRVTTRVANLQSAEECEQLVTNCSVVIHAAAALGGCASNLFLNTNVPTRELMTAAGNSSDVDRFVLVSSLGVYGPQRLKSNAILDESTPIDQRPHERDAYTYSKVVQEEIAWQLSNDLQLPLVVIRPGVIFGDERGVLSHRIGLPLGHWILRMGGSQPLPFTYVENCAAAVVLAAFADKAEGQAFNVVDDDLPTGKQVIRKYRKSGRKLRVLPVPQFAINWLARFSEWYSRRTENQIPAVLTLHRANAMWRSFRYSNQKAKDVLGWSPEVSIQTALERSLS